MHGGWETSNPANFLPFYFVKDKLLETTSWLHLLFLLKDPKIDLLFFKHIQETIILHNLISANTIKSS